MATDLYFRAGAATNLLVECVSTPIRVKTAWLSLLAVPGSLLYKEKCAPSEVYYVVDSFAEGVIVWHVMPYVHGGKRRISFIGPTSKPRWSYIHITELDGWKCERISAIPPCRSSSKMPDGSPKEITVGVPENNSFTILRFSGLNCFQGMTVPDMKELVKYLAVPVSRMPTLEKDLAKTLLDYLFPEKDDEQIASLMELRSYKKHVRFSSILEADGLERLVADIVDPDESKEMIASAKAYAKECDSMKVAAAAKAKAKPKAKSASKATTKAKKLATKDMVAVASAQKYLPPLASLCMEDVWHLRWKVSFPTEMPPHSTSRCFAENDEEAKRSALRFCLRWVWDQHLKLNPSDSCPWDLS